MAYSLIHFFCFSGFYWHLFEVEWRWLQGSIHQSWLWEPLQSGRWPKNFLGTVWIFICSSCAIHNPSSGKHSFDRWKRTSKQCLRNRWLCHPEIMYNIIDICFIVNNEIFLNDYITAGLHSIFLLISYIPQCAATI